MLDGLFLLHGRTVIFVTTKRIVCRLTLMLGKCHYGKTF